MKIIDVKRRRIHVTH